MKIVVEAKGLVKRYDDKAVVDGVDLEVRQGEIFGLLGPNGAGKSSVMRMMYGSSSMSEGELFVLGLNAKKNFREIKGRVGVVPQDDGLDSDFTALENLLLFASYHAIDEKKAQKRADELLRMMGLYNDKDKMIHALSGGMRRRLAIARGMINKPEVLFFDEPTSGLDPEARIWIWDLLTKIKDNMGTVVLTTHYMEEAERLCDRIAILFSGKILALGTPAELIKNEIGSEVVELEIPHKDLDYYTARLNEKKYKYQIIGDSLHVHLNETQKNQDVLTTVYSHKVTIRRANLNDVFLRLAGQSLRAEPL